MKKRKKIKHAEKCPEIKQICEKVVRTSGSQSGAIENVITNHDKPFDIDTEDLQDESLDGMDEDSESELDLSDDNCEGGKPVKNENKYLEELKSQLSLTDDDFLNFEKCRKRKGRQLLLRLENRKENQKLLYLKTLERGRKR